VDQRGLGRTGVEVSRLILGCGNFGGVGSAPAFFGQGTSMADAFALMDAAWDAGITTFDTADAYGGGRSETFIGAWLATKSAAVRDGVVITTKTYNPMAEGADRGLAPERIARQIDSSLRRLGVERVALYVAHEFDPDVPLEVTQAAFDALVKAGKIGAAGASNFSDAQLDAALGSSARYGQGRYEWVQNSFSLLDRGDTRGVLARCQADGLGYTPFSPLAGGWLTGKYRRGQAPPAGSRMTIRPEPYAPYRTDAVFDALEAMEALAVEHATTMVALAQAWVLAQPGVTAIVIGPNRFEQLRLALGSLEALDAATSTIPTAVLDDLSELFS
jgi:aryl-alcohol dehydrogenase-like predicted oxidoreductase